MALLSTSNQVYVVPLTARPLSQFGPSNLSRNRTLRRLGWTRDKLNELVGQLQTVVGNYKNLCGRRTLPKQTAAALSRINTFAEAQKHLEALGFAVLPHIQRVSPSAVSVSLAQPPGTIEYHAPQIVFSTVETQEVPRASILMNCLTPKTATEAEGQAIFSKFQEALLKLSQGLGALPFACITGHKDLVPEHVLSQRGFRFLFSSATAGNQPRINGFG